MSSRKIITHCAPTLAGIKTANLFNEYYEDEEELLKEIKRFNKMFYSYGLRMIPITHSNGRALIYLYRQSDLENDFQNKLSQKLLKEYGYDSNDIYKSIKRLASRISEHNNFPHEIGLFLGYPPEDVKGFIDNKAQNYKLSGYWKVYGDPKRAEKLFEKYKSCQRILASRLSEGLSLKELVASK